MTQGKCHKCGDRSVAVKIVRMLDGKAQNVYLCRECASEESPLQKQGFTLQEAIEKALEQLVKKHSEQSEAPEDLEAEGPRCPACGTTFGTYRKSFMLGCSECYGVFGGMLDPQLRRIHGSTRHVGRVPESTRKCVGDGGATLTDLRSKLARAVSKEDFEKAAELRDRIRLLRGGSDHAFPEMPKM